MKPLPLTRGAQGRGLRCRVPRPIARLAATPLLLLLTALPVSAAEPALPGVAGVAFAAVRPEDRHDIVGEIDAARPPGEAKAGAMAPRLSMKTLATAATAVTPIIHVITPTM